MFARQELMYGTVPIGIPVYHSQAAKQVSHRPPGYPVTCWGGAECDAQATNGGVIWVEYFVVNAALHCGRTSKRMPNSSGQHVLSGGLPELVFLGVWVCVCQDSCWNRSPFPLPTQPTFARQGGGGEEIALYSAVQCCTYTNTKDIEHSFCPASTCCPSVGVSQVQHSVFRCVQ